MGYARGPGWCVDWNDEYSVTVAGRKWVFEWHDYLGPTWLRKDGEPRIASVPAPVWQAFARWLRRYYRKHPSRDPRRQAGEVRTLEEAEKH